MRKTILILFFLTVLLLLKTNTPNQTSFIESGNILDVSYQGTFQDNQPLLKPSVLNQSKEGQQTEESSPTDQSAIEGAHPILNALNTADINAVLNLVTSEITESSVAILRMQNDTVLERGSGVVIDEVDGYYYILTNYHTISDDSHLYKSYDLEVYVNQYWTQSAQYVGHSFAYDLAVIKIPNNYLLRVAVFADDETVQNGDLVFSVGTSNQDRFNAVNMGIVSGTNRYIYHVDGTMKRRVIQHDAVVNPGYSGGGLFDIDGHLIGINTAKLAEDDFEGVFYAIPLETLRAVSKSLIETGEFTLPITGVKNFYNITSFPTKEFPFGILGGVVYEVDPLYQKSVTLQNFDLITEIDGYPIYSGYDIYDYLLRCSAGDTLTVTFYRNNRYLEAEIMLY